MTDRRAFQQLIAQIEQDLFAQTYLKTLLTDARATNGRPPQKLANGESPYQAHSPCLPKTGAALGRGFGALPSDGLPTVSALPHVRESDEITARRTAG